MALKPVSQKQFVVTLGASTGANASVTFNKVSAVKLSYDTFDATDPTLGHSETYPTFEKWENITLTKHYEPGDGGDPLLNWFATYRTQSPRPELTITIQPVIPNTDGSPLPGSKATQLVGCKVLSIQMSPEIDRDGSNSATIEMEISIKDAK